MNVKKRYVVIGSIVLVVILFFIFRGSDAVSENEILIAVKKGTFRVEVNTSGELEARNSTYIMGPGNLRKYRIYGVSIQSIIPEGTYVKKGDFIASLDPSEFNSKLADNQIELEEDETRFLQTKLDTALIMREARDRLINLRYAIEEKQLTLDQSQFEPPATIKRAELELQKSIRELEQEKENYKIKEQQNIAKMQIASGKLRKTRLEMQGMHDMQKSFTITAPEDGMLIYRKGMDGKPMKEGSQVNTWDPAVATLPDLSTMNSITYVNEVDIRRIRKGQTVEIGLDAFPERKLIGKVTDVANVGETKPNSDAKVFKVTVEIDKIDQLLKPGMTTSNNIITQEIENTLFVPLESLHSFQDSVSYVFKQRGLSYIKQEVQVGETNANSAEIKLGLTVDDNVYLSTPASSDTEEIELLAELKGKRNLKTPDPEPAPVAPQERSGSPFKKKKPNS